MPAGDVYRISMQGIGQNSVYMNVLAIQQIGALDLGQADFQTFADGFKEAVRPVQNLANTWRSWRAVQLFGPNVDYTVKPCHREGGFAFEGNLTGTLTGGETGSEILPPQSSLVITLGSGQVGRRHRGRIYLWGMGEAQQNAGIWTAACLTNLTTPFTTFFNKYKDTGTDPKIKLGIWSERTAFGCEFVGKPPVHTQIDPPNPDQAFTPTTGFTIRNVVYTQRRRALGVGR